MLERVLVRKTPARSELRKVAEERRRETLDQQGKVLEFVDRQLARQGFVTLAAIESWEVRTYQRATSPRAW